MNPCWQNLLNLETQVAMYKLTYMKPLQKALKHSKLPKQHRNISHMFKQQQPSYFQNEVCFDLTSFSYFALSAESASSINYARASWCSQKAWLVIRSAATNQSKPALQWKNSLQTNYLFQASSQKQKHQKSRLWTKFDAWIPRLGLLRREWFLVQRDLQKSIRWSAMFTLWRIKVRHSLEKLF